MASSEDGHSILPTRPSGGTGATARPRAGGWRTRVERRASWAFLSAPLLLYVTFLVGPLIATIILSLFSWDTFAAPEFVGLRTGLRTKLNAAT
jgi:hypothetical protein